MDNFDLLNALKQRHSVRHYQDKPIPQEIRQTLVDVTNEINQKSGLDLQIFFDEPEGFSKCLLNYGKLTNVTNYVAIVGSDDDKLDIKAGYYGQRLVLIAGALGLNTCWVALTFNKAKCKAVVKDGQRLALVIALGYGQTQGVQHKGKPVDKLCKDYDTSPDWFKNGVDCACLSPTAMNQQKFRFTCLGDGKVLAEKGVGFYSLVDLGIVCHDFEVGANRQIEWKFNLNFKEE